MPTIKKEKETNSIPPVETSIPGSSSRPKPPSVVSNSLFSYFRHASRDGDPHLNAIESESPAHDGRDQPDNHTGANPPGKENNHFKDVEITRRNAIVTPHESIHSTRNALMMAKQAEETAEGLVLELEAEERRIAAEEAEAARAAEEAARKAAEEKARQEENRKRALADAKRKLEDARKAREEGIAEAKRKLEEARRVREEEARRKKLEEEANKKREEEARRKRLEERKRREDVRENEKSGTEDRTTREHEERHRRKIREGKKRMRDEEGTEGPSPQKRARSVVAETSQESSPEIRAKMLDHLSSPSCPPFLADMLPTPRPLKPQPQTTLRMVGIPYSVVEDDEPFELSKPPADDDELDPSYSSGFASEESEEDEVEVAEAGSPSRRAPCDRCERTGMGNKCRRQENARALACVPCNRRKVHCSWTDGKLKREVKKKKPKFRATEENHDTGRRLDRMESLLKKSPQDM
ncbi:hypothetical protein F5878DRAFT_614700 [Lentinula raphanica]|uniref:Uncharacterized protein n=1 Tax=Lentinula raphanica TaxID=153919 RepID=A0AA38UFU2_9AGAR|nr:hypothetical protein F5878DRAFT_614700 [Lentinula raphanica]